MSNYNGSPSSHPDSTNIQSSSFYENLKQECYGRGLTNTQALDFIAVFESMADERGLITLKVEPDWRKKMSWVKSVMLDNEEGLKERDMFSEKEIKRREGAGAKMAERTSASKGGREGEEVVSGRA